MIKVTPLDGGWSATFPSMEEASGFIKNVKKLGVEIDIKESEDE